MAKWCGTIGFTESSEVEAGLWVEDDITERRYYGDVMSNRWRHQSSSKVIDDVTQSITVSIVADPYAYEHCSSMKYATVMGTKWKIESVEPQYPRLLLTIGEVYK